MNKVVKNKAWLHRETARVIDLCEGTVVNYVMCITHCGMICDNEPYSEYSHFGNPEDYSFAVCIVEGKPLFPGDIIYNKHTGEKATVIATEIYMISNITLIKPKPKTFTLNGTEINMPDGDNDDGYFIKSLEQFKWKYYDDRDKVVNILIKLLSGE